MDQNARILIVGAGIAGTALARSLEMQGFRAQVIEKRNQWSPQGYAISLMPPGANVLKQIGLYDATAKYGAPLQQYELQTGSGKLIRRFDLSQLGNRLTLITLPRPYLQRTLLDSLEQTRVAWGRAIQTVKQTPEQVCVTFDSGEKDCFDLLIGADGVYSSVRQLAFSEAQLRYQGALIVAYRMRLGDLGHDASMVLEVWDERGQFGIYPYGEFAGIAFAFPFRDQTEIDSAHMVQQAQRVYAGFRNAKVQSALDILPSLESPYTSKLYTTHIAKWYNRRVAIIGDAAHAILPTAGMGASLALGDAQALALAIAQESDYSDAFDRFAQERRAYVNSVQRESIFLKHLMLAPKPIALLRDAVLRVIPNSWYVNLLT